MIERRRGGVEIRVCDYGRCQKEAAIRVEFLGADSLDRRRLTYGTWDFCSFVHAMAFRDKTIAKDVEFAFEEAR